MPPVGLLSTWPAVESFVFGGNATFTLKSLRTGVRFTYKVRAKKEDLLRLQNRPQGTISPDPTTGRREVPMTLSEVVYFVNLLRGPDNTADFAYMGVLRKDPARFFWTAASGRVGRTSSAYKGLLWLIERMNTGRTGILGEQVEVWHSGTCGCCGRKLTVPESVASGYGPFCQRRNAA